ncbi:MAG TPA: hypothetical protein VH062_07615 [Polyangiaceae bacterium]|jgi:hypothetical protein|nr:hypothetical protein [Polyangiaceae bacterium]
MTTKKRTSLLTAAVKARAAGVPPAVVRAVMNGTGNGPDKRTAAANLLGIAAKKKIKPAPSPPERDPDDDVEESDDADDEETDVGDDADESEDDADEDVEESDDAKRIKRNLKRARKNPGSDEDARVVDGILAMNRNVLSAVANGAAVNRARAAGVAPTAIEPTAKGAPHLETRFLSNIDTGKAISLPTTIAEMRAKAGRRG